MIGQDETGSGFTKGRVDWTLGKISSQKGCQVLEQAAQGSGIVTIPGGISKMRRCGTQGPS